MPDLASTGKVRAALREWWANGGEPQELPAEAAFYALDCHGMEANPVGTRDALLAVSVECPGCDGEGFHQDDSHPGNPAIPCVICHGHRRIPTPNGSGVAS
jgi:hypothetical protein